ncbi:hypothetical protein [Nonomuraea aridisoli]|uniref:Uncharacterized protein n=1 Tax=Nonomuraea aridisoli TaxID=2070368 RepID=A0A2W2DAW9_9ACTN|nr:hypothetical protein [Nonomuraea aridisoli]PZG09152.1 hypothetical protein C1J01_38020 [Nonomuraea aridisoli]
MKSPLAASEFLVIQFDRRDASLVVIDNVGYSAANRDDAVKDAKAAAERARAAGLPLDIMVVRLVVEEHFPIDEE